MRDNASFADNQQERLHESFRGWIGGFVDGEGCFSIGFVAQPQRLDANRPLGRRTSYRTGYQVSHEFAVVQGARSRHCLDDLHQFFGVGSVSINRRHDNHKEDLYRYAVRKRDDLLNVIIPFFRQHPLRSAKQQDFERFAHVVEMMKQDEHKSYKGLLKIAYIIEKMNHRKPRTALIRILRDQTPGIRAVSTKKLHVLKRESKLHSDMQDLPTLRLG